MEGVRVKKNENVSKVALPESGVGTPPMSEKAHPGVAYRLSPPCLIRHPGRSAPQLQP